MIVCCYKKTAMNTENLHRDLVPERQKRVLEIVRQRNAVRVDELCEALSVSPATIRRDLEMLEAEGVLRRVHGGAVGDHTRLEEPLFDDKTRLAGEEKVRIARQAYSHVREGDTVYLDGGSTILELARLLRERTDITVVTNSLRAASELAVSGPRLILLGGEFRRRSQTIVGTLTRSLLETIYLDTAFMGTIGVTEQGLTTTDPNEAYTKELVMTRAQKVVLLADSTKIGKVSFAHAGNPGDIGLMITDGGANPRFIKKLKKLGVAVEVAI